MELRDVLKNRRSIRAFQSKKVDKRIIEDILSYGILAPSSKNKQPWYFVILEDDKKNKVANLMIDYVNNCKESQERKKYGFNSSVKETALVIKEAPILILIFREKDDNWIIGDNLSIGACVENMCLRATDLGLGSLWIRDIVYVAEEVADMLEHSDMELNCAISFGYQNEFPKQRPRKELKKILEWYK